MYSPANSAFLIQDSCRLSSPCPSSLPPEELASASSLPHAASARARPAAVTAAAVRRAVVRPGEVRKLMEVLARRRLRVAPDPPPVAGGGAGELQPTQISVERALCFGAVKRTGGRSQFERRGFPGPPRRAREPRSALGEVGGGRVAEPGVDAVE